MKYLGKKKIIDKLHYKSKRSINDFDNIVIVTACSRISDPPPKVTRNKDKVICKKCRKSYEFRQKTMLEKFLQRLRKKVKK